MIYPFPLNARYTGNKIIGLFMHFNLCSLLFTILFCMTPLLNSAQGDSNVQVTEAFQTDVQYITKQVKVLDHSKKQTGYWTFLPDVEQEKTKKVIVFIHGYGGYNPLIYGAWIKHLTKQGHIVIYPRYQKTLYIPKTEKFVKNAVKGLQNAITELESLGFKKELWQTLDYVVHSYGGVISSNMAINYEEYEIPSAKNMLLCAPGSGPFKGGRLDSYEGLKEDINLLIVVNKNDLTVGDSFAKLVYNTAKQTKNRAYLMQEPSKTKEYKISAGHNECYCLDEDFDCGIRNYTSKKALRIAETNTLDVDGYWKLFDLLIREEDRFQVFDKEFTTWPLSDSALTPLKVLHPKLDENEIR